ncbi:MAG: hypothetical protein R3F31_21235 [Verrucomicrobiales bacterium]
MKNERPFAGDCIQVFLSNQGRIEAQLGSGIDGQMNLYRGHRGVADLGVDLAFDLQVPWSGTA